MEKKEKIETERYEDVREERREGWRDEEVTMMERNERKKGEKHCQKKKDQEKERERERAAVWFFPADMISVISFLQFSHITSLQSDLHYLH